MGGLPGLVGAGVTAYVMAARRELPASRTFELLGASSPTDPLLPA